MGFLGAHSKKLNSHLLTFTFRNVELVEGVRKGVFQEVLNGRSENGLHLNDWEGH
jgi:hypothetical protein